MLTRAERRGGLVGGGVGVALILAAIGIPVAALLARSAGLGADAPIWDTYLWRVVRFTLLQAFASTTLSLLLAIPLARALARRPRFFGRSFLLRLFAVPLGLPALVAALGLIEIWGRQGIINGIAAFTGFDEPFSIYGLPGILIAHVFFNLPLATRMLTLSLERTPGEYWKTAAVLGMGAPAVFRLIEWPAMAKAATGAAGLVFMLCITSFTLVLILGGGPAATTLEVAIYQALRFDFDPQRAVLLAVAQMTLTGLVLVVLSRLPAPVEHADSLGSSLDRPDVAHGWSCVADFALVVPAALFVGAPLAAVLLAGLAADLPAILSERLLWRATATSLSMAAAAALVSTGLALLLIRARHAASDAPGGWLPRGLSGLAGAAGSIVLLAPPVVLGAGWFVVFSGAVSLTAAPIAIVIMINSLMALPFVMRVIEPAHATAMAQNGRLALALGVTGKNRLLRVDLPALKRPLLTAGSFAMALSLGDLGAVVLFGGDRLVTLPWLLLQKMGAYRTHDAAGIALLLGCLCLALMVLSEHLARSTKRMSM